MSRVVWDSIHQQRRISVLPAKKLPPNPHIDGGITDRLLAPPSETDSVNSSQVSRIETKSDKSLRYRLLLADQRTFLTGSASADLKACHIINTVRKDESRKMEVQALLTEQGFHGVQGRVLGFELDDTVNAILLESSFHVHWDLYGTFCIVPARNDAESILTALKLNNQEWVDRCTHARVPPPRPLNILEPPFAKPSWEIVVLHPRALLPDNQPLAILQNRTLVESRQVQQPESPPNWTFWIAKDDHLCSASPPHDAFPSFVTTNARVRCNFPEISSLAMIVNAHSKLQQYMENHGSDASARVQDFARLMDKLVTEIFFVPPSVMEIISREFPQQDPATNARSGHSTEEINQVPPNFTQDESEPEHPPDSPGEDGLTDSEFRIVASRAQDGQLDARERANAAMMMIFGTRRYEDPNIR